MKHCECVHNGEGLCPKTVEFVCASCGVHLCELCKHHHNNRHPGMVKPLRRDGRPKRSA